MKHGLDTSFLVAVEVGGHKDHHVARAVAESLRRKGDRFVIAPHVLAEFMHVVTDPRRFSSPLTMDQALRRAEAWWNSNDVDWALPDERAVTWFLKAMREERLRAQAIAGHLTGGNLSECRC